VSAFHDTHNVSFCLLIQTFCEQKKTGTQILSHKFPKDPIRYHEWVKSLNLHHFEDMYAQELQKYSLLSAFSKTKLQYLLFTTLHFNKYSDFFFTL